MRTLQRNKRAFYYALYKSQVMNKDEYGNEDGTPVISYDTPVRMMANISSASGNSQIEQFGTSVQYDKVIVTDDMSCPIDENTILYVDVIPGETAAHDYIVKRVAKSLNSIAYAISKVNVS